MELTTRQSKDTIKGNILNLIGLLLIINLLIAVWVYGYL